jgi:hypothetical protein
MAILKKQLSPAEEKAREEAKRINRVFLGLKNKVLKSCRDGNLASEKLKLEFLKNRGGATPLPTELGLQDTIRAFQSGIDKYLEEISE